MVPLLAIGLGLLAAFPGFEAMRHDLMAALFHTLVPEVGDQVQLYVGRFAANAGRLKLIGIIGLVATAVMLLVAIEAALNRIFRVPQQRAAWSRLVVYWAALILGPLLAGVSLTMSAWFSVLPWVKTMHLWAGRATTADIRGVVSDVTPFAIMTVAFTILFLVAPNRRVRVSDALCGGIVAALLLLALRTGFGLYIAFWGAYRPVYGAVASVPIFLAWVYLSWTAVLFGAEIAAALPELRRGRLEHGAPLSARRRLALALGILAALLKDAREEGHGMGRDALAHLAREGEQPVAEVLRRMTVADLVIRGPGNRYKPGDLDKAGLADLLRALEVGLRPLDLGGLASAEVAPWLARVDALIVTAARAEAASLQFSLRGLLEPSPDPT
jgi:membrane protein